MIQGGFQQHLRGVNGDQDTRSSHEQRHEEGDVPVQGVAGVVFHIKLTDFF
jgi:hypothetical protein